MDEVRNRCAYGSQQGSILKTILTFKGGRRIIVSRDMDYVGRMVTRALLSGKPMEFTRSDGSKEKFSARDVKSLESVE